VKMDLRTSAGKSKTGLRKLVLPSDTFISWTSRNRMPKSSVLNGPCVGARQRTITSGILINATITQISGAGTVILRDQTWVLGGIRPEKRLAQTAQMPPPISTKWRFAHCIDQPRRSNGELRWVNSRNRGRRAKIPGRRTAVFGLFT